MDIKTVVNGCKGYFNGFSDCLERSGSTEKIHITALEGIAKLGKKEEFFRNCDLKKAFWGKAFSDMLLAI